MRLRNVCNMQRVNLDLLTAFERDQQRTCLESFLRGHDLFIAQLPTSFGKSAVSQAAPLWPLRGVDFLRGLELNSSKTVQDSSLRLSKAVAVVVMPLKSLVADQLNRAELKNLASLQQICQLV